MSIYKDLVWQEHILVPGIETTTHNCCSILRGTFGANVLLGGFAYEVLDCENNVMRFNSWDEVEQYISLPCNKGDTNHEAA